MVKLKFRYILVEIVCEDFLEEKMLTLRVRREGLYSALFTVIEEILGDYGVAVVGSCLNVKMMNPHTRIAYIRVRHEAYKMLASVLPFITRIWKVKCSLRTLHIGGTIRSCHKYLRRYHHQVLPSLLARCSTDEEKEAVQASIKLSLKHVTDWKTSQLGVEADGHAETD